MGNKLYDVLRRKYIDIKQDKAIAECYTDMVRIHFPHHIFKRSGHSINAHGVVAFNTFFWLLIKDRARVFIHSYVLSKSCEIKEAIEVFLKEYNLEADVDFETLKRHYYDLRKQNSKRICVPNFPPSRRIINQPAHAIH